MDKDGRKARSFGFAAFLQAIEPVAKDLPQGVLEQITFDHVQSHD